MKRWMIGVAIATIAVASFVAWRLALPKTAGAAPHIGVVYDRSGSTTGGCEALVGLVEQGLKEQPLSPASTITIMGTGDETTSNEPVLVARFAGVKSRRVMEGKRGARRREEALFADLDGRCRELEKTGTSPIYLAVKRAVEELRSKHCVDGSGCILYVASDGEETAETRVAEAISAPKKKLRSLPAAIDNSGIVVHFCGLSDTSGSTDRKAKKARRERPVHDASRVDRIRTVWSSRFTEPDLVTFEPHCNRAAVGEAAKKVRPW